MLRHLCWVEGILFFFNVSLQKVLPFQQCAEETAYCVNHFSVVSLIFGLLFQIIVIENVFKRVPDLRYYYSGIFHGAESFRFVLCEFGLFGPVFTRFKEVVLCELVWFRVINFCLLL